MDPQTGCAYLHLDLRAQEQQPHFSTQCPHFPLCTWCPSSSPPGSVCFRSTFQQIIDVIPSQSRYLEDSLPVIAVQECPCFFDFNTHSARVGNTLVRETESYASQTQTLDPYQHSNTERSAYSTPQQTNNYFHGYNLRQPGVVVPSQTQPPPSNYGMSGCPPYFTMHPVLGMIAELVSWAPSAPIPFLNNP